VVEDITDFRVRETRNTQNWKPLDEAVHPSGILRHIAADGAGDLRGRVGRVVEAGIWLKLPTSEHASASRVTPLARSTTSGPDQERNTPPDGRIHNGGIQQPGLASLAPLVGLTLMAAQAFFTAEDVLAWLIIERRRASVRSSC
jgi:hypothetical protein